MNRRFYAAILPVLGLTVWAMAQTPGDPLIEGLRNVEVASVADAIEQLYAHTEGNPLFLLAMVEALQEQGALGTERAAIQIAVDVH